MDFIKKDLEMSLTKVVKIRFFCKIPCVIFDGISGERFGRMTGKIAD